MAAGFEPLATDTAIVRLSYRPAADLLVGTVQLPALQHSADSANWAWSARSEQPDADTSLVWHALASSAADTTHQHPSDDPHRAVVLASFEIVHAMARYESDTLPMLPRDLAASVAGFAREHQAAVASTTDIIERIRYCGRDELTMPLAALLQTEAVDTQAIPGIQREALQLARSIDRFAEAFGQLELIDDTEYPSVTRWCILARELACTLSERDAMPAPGSSAAVRRALRTGIPCRAETLEAIRRTFELIDDPARWVEASEILDRFTRALTRPDGGTAAAHREAQFA